MMRFVGVRLRDLITRMARTVRTFFGLWWSRFRGCIAITPFLPSSPLFVRYQPVEVRINQMVPESISGCRHQPIYPGTIVLNSGIRT
jgi:hypothetical protein